MSVWNGSPLYFSVASYFDLIHSSILKNNAELPVHNNCCKISFPGHLLNIMNKQPCAWKRKSSYIKSVDCVVDALSLWTCKCLKSPCGFKWCLIICWFLPQKQTRQLISQLNSCTYMQEHMLQCIFHTLYFVFIYVPIYSQQFASEWYFRKRSFTTETHITLLAAIVYFASVCPGLYLLPSPHILLLFWQWPCDFDCVDGILYGKLSHPTSLYAVIVGAIVISVTSLLNSPSITFSLNCWGQLFLWFFLQCIAQDLLVEDQTNKKISSTISGICIKNFNVTCWSVW